MVTANLAEYEAHLLDTRLYLEQKLLVSPISLYSVTLVYLMYSLFICINFQVEWHLSDVMDLYFLFLGHVWKRES